MARILYFFVVFVAAGATDYVVHKLHPAPHVSEVLACGVATLAAYLLYRAWSAMRKFGEHIGEFFHALFNIMEEG